MQTDQVSPTPPPTQPVLVREAPRSFWASLWPEVIIGSVVVGLALFGASWWSDDRRADKAEEIEAARALDAQRLENARVLDAERLENLRFVREVGTQAGRFGAFRDLDLAGMNLSALEFPCRTVATDTTEECLEGSADFTDADLSDANMTLMDLSGADFLGADLRGADLQYSDLRGTDLSGAKLDSTTKFEGNCQSNGTKWPTTPGFKEPQIQELGSTICGRDRAGNISKEALKD